jgi:hypothetical protein
MRGLETRLAAATRAIDRATTKAMEAAAKDLVALMKSLVPVGQGDLQASIDWTWGEAPEGSLAMDSLGSDEKQITIYAGAGLDIPAVARWVEFGTAPHNVAKGGGTKAGQGDLPNGKGTPHPGARAKPYFYPAYRAKKKAILARMRREIKAALKKV